MEHTQEQLDHVAATDVDVHFRTQWEQLDRSAQIVLAGVPRKAEEWLERIRSVGRAEQDELLAELLDLLREGEELAGRFLLHMFRPRILRLVATRSAVGLARQTRTDRVGHIYSAAWVALRSMPATCRTNLSACIAENIFREAHRTAEESCEAEDFDFDQIEAAEATRDPEEALAGLLAWANTSGSLDRDDIIMIARAYFSDATGAELSEEAGLSHGAYRMRLHRAKERLILAVQTHYKLLGM